MHAPVLGPTNPSDSKGMPAALRNHWSGHAEDAHLNSFTFDEQYHTFHSYGYAANPAGSGGMVAAKAVQGVGNDTIYTSAPKRQKTETDKKAGKAAAPAFNPEVPFVLKTRQPWAEKETVVPELTEEQEAYVAQMKESKAEKAVTEGKGETSIFHGKEEKDYQGRSWVDVPADKHKEGDTCFLPKRHIHTWSGHTKGVNAIR